MSDPFFSSRFSVLNKVYKNSFRVKTSINISTEINRE